MADEGDIAAIGGKIGLSESIDVEAIGIDADHGGHESRWGVTEAGGEFGASVADCIIEAFLAASGFGAVDIGEAILHPHDDGDLFGDAAEFGAVVIDDDDEVGCEIGAGGGDGEAVAGFVVLLLDQQAGLMAELLEGGEPVAHRILEEGREARGDAEDFERDARGELSGEGTGRAGGVILAVACD